VTVAELKAKLSEYLRRAESGETVLVCRHGAPVAKLAPVERSRLTVRPPREGGVRPGEGNLPPLKMKRDILDYLAEERADRDLLEGFDRPGDAGQSAEHDRSSVDKPPSKAGA
jgi:prevent-host-death family protein